MSEAIRKARRGMFGAAVAVALAFGVATALVPQPASAAIIPACQDPAAQGGACNTQEWCRRSCAARGYDPSGAWCVVSRYCCYCDLR